jgi:hypothetical protein
MLDKMQYLISGQRCRLIFAASVMLWLSACASNVVVKSTFPRPLVPALPLDGALVLTEDFKSYTYFENAKARKSLKSLDMAAAHIMLFENVFDSLINLVGPEFPTKDLVIVPELLDFQYSSPSETQLKQYEVWLKYRLKITNGMNQKIADWTIKGYGKTPTSMLASAGSAFSAATTVALRDVGAQLAIQFPQQQVIQDILKGKAPDIIEEASAEEVVASDGVALDLEKSELQEAESLASEIKADDPPKKSKKNSKWEVNDEN